MKIETINPFKDSTWIIGIISILISGALYFIPEWLREQEFNFTGGFAVNYIIAIIYLIILTVKKVLRKKEKGIYLPLLFVLFLISCFSLNRDLSIFSDATLWVKIYLIVIVIAFIGLTIRSYLPFWLLLVLHFSLGISIVLCIYYSFYLLPMYLISIIASFVLGLSLHTFIPLAFVIYIIFYITRDVTKDSRLLTSFFAGVLAPIIFIVYFLFNWKATSEKITFTVNSTITDYSNTLPIWIKVSQILDKNWISEKIIKSKLLYEVPNKDFSLFETPTRGSFNEAIQHDPLVVIASTIVKHPTISKEERIKILEALYDSRHLAQERLWSGNALRTSNIITDVMIYPDLRISYTEKIINIKNTLKEERWNTDQEAIFTFNLPEGSVVTSLSLWINGEEEKGVLTTKNKADSAYKTIVGVEVRDPSVVHWQEGNTVSVRVFPCSSKEDRRFKIGFTSPLSLEGNKVKYKNITFKGPSPEEARESIIIRLSKINNSSLEKDNFKKISDKTYRKDGEYKEDWEISFNKKPIPQNSFSFEGNNYSICESKIDYSGFIPDSIFLDINSSWTEEELETVWNLVKDRKVFVYRNRMVKLTKENRSEIFNDKIEHNFSLFPFYKIKSQLPLIITKSQGLSPNLDDLKGSGFVVDLESYLVNQRKIKLFSLSNYLSPYLKSLKEFRVFEHTTGDLNNLKEILKSNKFPLVSEGPSVINIDEAGIKITKSAHGKKDNAPDHLMRLFSYNEVLKEIGSSYFKNDFINEQLIAKAQQSNIVTPVSSLIVLESQNDYQRFDIKNSENGLQNASMASSGAVPEPHEWALIIIALSVIGYLITKQYQLKRNAA